MELAPNGTFLDVVNNHYLGEDEKLVRTYFRQLVDAVDYMHTNGVYHMDVKTDNLLIGKDMSLKLADFDSC